MQKIHRLRHAFFLKMDINSADLITTISKGTVEKLHQFYDVENAICVSPGVNRSLYFKRSNEEIARILNKHKINSKFYLCIGTVEPRKNINNAIKAFIECKKLSQLKNYQLVIVGKDGWLNNPDYKDITDSKIYGVMRLGYIEDGDLPALYSATDALIFPSIYEGYGMPVSECLSCGSMVIASDTIEIREAGKDSALYIKPTIKNIMNSMVNVASNSIKISYQPNEWDDAARNLSIAFEEILIKE
jgi:glycosyltransferase involved in cell wall biosynthesis